MKKILVSVAFMLSMVSYFHDDSTREIIQTSHTEKTILSSNGYLSFTDRYAFEQQVEKLVAGEQSLVQIERDYNFISLKTHYLNSKTSRLATSAPVINSEILSTILNHDAMVKIGDWILKVNPEKGKVYAIHTKNEKHYKDVLAESENNRYVLVFSTSEDVLHHLEKWNTRFTRIKC